MSSRVAAVCSEPIGRQGRGLRGASAPLDSSASRRGGLILREFRLFELWYDAQHGSHD